MDKRESIKNWLRGELASREVSLARLAGATSSTLLKVDADGQPFVLRLFNESNWPEGVDDLPGKEAQILQTLSASKIPAPKFIASAEAGSSIGAAVLMSWLPGKVVLPSAPSSKWLATLARSLAAIHNITLPPLPWHYTSWQRMTGRAAPGWFGDDALWHTVQGAVTKRSTPRFSEPERCFLHRDYHPVNVLWQGEVISGVVDWVNACMGPPGVDVAHCRLNLVLMYGLAAADGFLDAYRDAVHGYEHHHYWDLDAALAWFPDPTSYPPWQEFGLSPIDPALLKQRIRDFLIAATG
ncbi:MAG: aminoglycoside phosphotransferase family protein [Gammaproteobacteria bacterium]|nr:aminoglycoside phosphotransferase family protein [Gammaproteobacteria bacterium]